MVVRAGRVQRSKCASALTTPDFICWSLRSYPSLSLSRIKLECQRILSESGCFFGFRFEWRSRWIIPEKWRTGDRATTNHQPPLERKVQVSGSAARSRFSCLVLQGPNSVRKDDIEKSKSLQFPWWWLIGRDVSFVGRYYQPVVQEEITYCSELWEVTGLGQ